jgi:hypothetical protein
MAVYHPWSSAVPFFTEQAPAGVSEMDQHRVRAYNLYEQMYWNHPETFRLLQRDTDQNPIYLPSARKIVEATHRFLAVDFDFVVETAGGTDGDKEIVDTFFRDLFKRERFFPKFNDQKRWGLVRGDAIWHITADPAKAEGQRISIHAVHPGQYFPITDENNPDRTIGVHLVDTVKDPDDDNKEFARVQTYRKVEGTTTITSELAWFEIGKWDDRYLEPNDIEKVRQIVQPTPLPSAITQIPVYHVKSSEEGFFGSSLVRGIETVIAAVNQSISDEDLALVMAGLGGYWTDAAPPINEAGEATSWELGPLRMTEVPPGSQVGRLAGVGSVAPSQDHIKMLLGESSSGVGATDIAMGNVEVQIAESGIALQLRMSPLLAANAEREMSMLAVYDQMFYDINRMWLPAYESLQTEVNISAIVGDPMPTNREAKIKEIMDLKAAGLITAGEARQMLIDAGVQLASADAAELLAETEATARAADPFAARVDEELGNAQGAAEDAPSFT